nr:uncharacterized protein LOC111506211 [Leptinotarsa decemlineata]
MRGTFFAIQDYLPKYNSSGEGLVLNTASVLGIETLSNTHAYGATKHGVVGLGKSLGKDESCLKHNIRVITLCPGLIHTPMIGDLNTIKKPSDVSEEVAEMCKKVSSTDYIAEAVSEIMNKAEHGSVWVTEDEEPPYQLVFPNRKEMRKTS